MLYHSRSMLLRAAAHFLTSMHLSLLSLQQLSLQIINIFSDTIVTPLAAESPVLHKRSVCFFLFSLLNTGIQLVKWHIWDLNLQRGTLLLVHFYVPRPRAVLSMWCELRNLFPFLFFFFLFSMRSLFMIL